MYVVNRLPETLRSDLVGIDFSRELNMFREAGQTEFRIGISQYQKTPHCYETCIFDWDHPFENVFWTDLFAFIERKYIENGNIPRDIGLRPQLIHYPRVFGGLGTHVHDSSTQKVGVVCLLSSNSDSGSFYVEMERQIFFANESVGDCIVFDFSLRHGVLTESKDPAFKFHEPDFLRANIDLSEIGRLVAVLTSE